MRVRVLKVVGNLCNETIDPRDGKWLEELLCSDAEVRNLYLDYMSLHASLHAEGASLALHSDSEDVPEEGLLTLASHREHAPVAEKKRSPKTWLFLAVALFGVALFSSLGTYVVSQPGAWLLGERVSEDSSKPVVAMITGTRNCKWDLSSGSIGYGSELVAGQKLELQQGVAEITFQDGATVLMESPASFVVQASHQFQLHAGRMSAVVPSQSRGFRVRTRSLDVFDVGTEYGLFAQKSGTAEVHVFNGLVKADVLDSSGRRLRRLELNASQAARVNSVSTTILEFPANESEFVRNMLPSSGPHDGLLAYESFDYPEGPLAAQNGGFGWAGPWFEIAADQNAGPSSNQVNSGSLTVEGFVPQGNRAALTSHENRIRRSLGTAIGGVFDVGGLVENQDGLRLIGRDGQEIYISFIQRVSAIGDNFYGIELHRGDGNANRVLCVGHGVEGTGYGVTSNTNVYGPKNFPSLGEENTEANLFVLKITFGAGDQDLVEVYRNPRSLRDEKSCRADAVLKGNFAFDRISLANFHGEKIHEVDEIRVGTHFLAVTGRWGRERGNLLRHITKVMPRLEQNVLFQSKVLFVSGVNQLPLLGFVAY